MVGLASAFLWGKVEKRRKTWCQVRSRVRDADETTALFEESGKKVDDGSFGAYSRETSRPKVFALIQSIRTRTRLRAVLFQSAILLLLMFVSFLFAQRLTSLNRDNWEKHLLLKHMLR